MQTVTTRARVGFAVAAVAVGVSGMTAAPAQAAPVAEVAAPTAASVASARNYYGAIAINTRTGASAYSYDYKTKSAAINAALKKCKRYAHGSSCRTAIWVRNACGAVAYKTYSNGSWRYQSAWATSKKAAIARAKRPLGKGAKTLTWVCTTRYQ